MQLSHAVRAAAWALIGLNLLLAFGAIAVFVRMAPAIAVIIERNERSLEAGEDMLAALALSQLEPAPGTVAIDRRQQFTAALARAQGNITEAGETETLAIVSAQHQAAFAGDTTAIRATISAVADLTAINRRAMRVADERAQQLGKAGAWGVVLMALAVLTVTLIFIRSILRRVIAPLVEIHEVLSCSRGRDRFRRCRGSTSPSREITAIYQEINALLDERLARTDCAVGSP